MVAITGTGRRSMRSSRALTRLTPSTTCCSLLISSNSRTSAPTMKPFSLPEPSTRPRILLSRTPPSTCSTICASSSSGRWPREFWLSPSRSNAAQAIPCWSIEKRQSRNAISAMVASLRRTLHCPGIVAGRHVMGPYLGRIEMVDGDGALGELFQLAQHRPFAFRQHVLGDGLADPIVAVQAPHAAGTHGTVEFLFSRLGLDRLGEGHLQEAGGIVGAV